MDLSHGELKRPTSQIDIKEGDNRIERFKQQLSNLKFISYTQSDPLDSYDIHKHRYQWRKTKSIVTAGPSLRTKQQFKELLKLDEPLEQSDIDGIRLNLSHNTHEFHQSIIQAIRDLREEYPHSYKLDALCILAELRGAQIRTQVIDGDPIPLKKGQHINMCVDSDSDQVQFDEEDADNLTLRVNLSSFDDLQQRVDLEAFDQILIDYGRLILRVDKINDDGKYIRALLVNSGKLGPSKYVTFYHQPNEFSITEKDKNDLRFCIEQGIDVVTFPYVQSVDNVKAARQSIRDAAQSCVHCVEEHDLPAMFSKISDGEGLFSLEEIAESSDGIIVSRGTLGVNLPLHSVAVIQKMIIDHCNAVNRPVLVFDQVLRTMYKNPRPTRAETSDIINASLDGCDGVMVAITAHGSYSMEAVKNLALVLKEADRSDHAIITKPITSRDTERPVLERSSSFIDQLGDLEEEVNRLLSNNTNAEQPSEPSVEASYPANHRQETARKIGHNAANMANRLDANIMVVVSERGQMARFTSKCRPKALILCATPHRRVAHQIAMIRGVTPFIVEPIRNTGENNRELDVIDEKKMSKAVQQCLEAGRHLGMVDDGELVLATSGVKKNTAGSQTHVLEVIPVPKKKK
eukprot:gb/GECH01014098.1/.p1 GENE.gb/GECH01014098.1/~~gb/GECH01014098.1/.p1  ORF type:complete len:632 (+),score=125.25 gb/GECH01014098.1/:1-1896(+)